MVAAVAEKLIVVVEAFVARGRGVLVEPRFTPTRLRAGPFPVRLVLPDGRQRESVAELEIAHVRGALTPYAMIRLPELGVDDVPPGTEVWALE